jgi:hypothetical protein
MKAIIVYCFLHLGWLVLWWLTHFQQYFSYIVAVSFIGGGNRSTGRKLPTYHKSLTNFITLMLYQVHLAISRI